MRPNRLLLTLSLAALAAPAALGAHPSAPATPGGHGSGKDPVKQAKGPKGTNYLLHACVFSDATPGAPATDTTDATDAGVVLTPLGGNRHMRDALTLNNAPQFTATLDDKTFFRLVGEARPSSVHGKKAGIGTLDDINAGDRVIVRFWDKRGSNLHGVPAWRVIDRGPTDACPVPATPPPADPPVTEPPPSTL